MTKKERREKKFQHCKNLLDELGEYSSDEIAEVMLMNGARGMRKAVMQCPLARYLRKQGVEKPIVKVGAVWLTDGVIIYDIPVSVDDFIVKFDMGTYPYLEADEEGVCYE